MPRANPFPLLPAGLDASTACCGCGGGCNETVADEDFMRRVHPKKLGCVEVRQLGGGGFNDGGCQDLLNTTKWTDKRLQQARRACARRACALGVV